MLDFWPPPTLPKIESSQIGQWNILMDGGRLGCSIVQFCELPFSAAAVADDMLSRRQPTRVGTVGPTSLMPSKSPLLNWGLGALPTSRRGSRAVRLLRVGRAPQSLGAFAERLQHPVGLGRLGRHNDDRESRAPPWPPLKPAATEVRFGIELSPCSAACPSGTIYLHLLPARNLCWPPQRLLGGTSVGWPPVQVRICSTDGWARLEGREQPRKLRAKREAKAIMKLAGRDKFQLCNLHVIRLCSDADCACGVIFGEAW
ncbi:hypothetical protein THAOC_18628 [Thalassiosira oceanica]|uniref:Uncharacterized protein n=1 Tax=Thalassiosira oceanica TaxID=159749 RepID=K0S6N5_THAOC|nr:hypothetical protein THAOC_18628 [Thalassiosira oceanica]|eukprot:EJK60950.1 hypothetical protein THAOC_18628 [Thalassiosira oceanica]